MIDNKDRVFQFKDLVTMKCDMNLDYDDYFKRYM